MIRFIENIGDYFSQHFFNEDFPKKVFDKSGYVTQKKDDNNIPIENHITTINSKVAPLREKYFRFKNEFLNIQRTKDRVKLTHDFHTDLLKILDYKNAAKEYDNPVYLNENEIVPVRLQYYKGDRPYLFIMEMQAMIKEGDDDPQGIFDQIYQKEDWEKVYPVEWNDIQIKPDVINEALTELFILPEEERPEYVIMLAAPKIFLIHYEKWKYDSFLLFNLEELFTESQVSANRDYLSLFYALLSQSQFISETDSILHVLEEDAHKAMHGVTQTLKNSVIYAVESLANEAIYYKLSVAKSHEERTIIEQLMASDTFARELKDECLTFVYRLLFLFYAESREDLEILPVKDTIYQKGYSLEMLRDLEMVPLTSDSSRNGNFFSQSLWKLFTYLHKGQENENGFTMKPLDSPLFENDSLTHLKEVGFRNFVLQEIILRLSLSERTKNKGRGRISYSNLGINQLGSVYESLLAYSGFFAAEPLIEVKAAEDTDGKEGTYLVPKKRRDDFQEDEILKDPEYPERDMEIEKGKFVYRLNGRDRKKSASYYTPEVLTQTTVKYTISGILEKLKERQNNGEECADEILKLKILEPAMGAAAFQNEVINQLSVAYLELKENELVKRNGNRIIPGKYKDEIQKVKAFIASHNVYGVDLNPTAIELGKLSLWLNCMHRDMETPFFAHRLGIGNAIIGAWLKVYNPIDFIVEFPTEGTPKQRKTPVLKDWWNKAPQRVEWKNGKFDRKEDQIYHFLLPDDKMVASSAIKMLKDELTEAEVRAFNKWLKEFKLPIRGEEHIRLKRISRIIDVLIDEHYHQTKKINHETDSHYNLYGQIEGVLDFKNYKEKERLFKLRNDRSAPYFKLKTVMDYWCSLWFWDVRKVADLPTREQWYNEVEIILGLDIEKLSNTEITRETITGFEQIRPEQQSLFGGPKQMSIGSKSKTQDQTERIKQLIADYSGDTSSLYQLGRIKYVQELSGRYKFFHNELEFIEVFMEKNGFDIIVGNPPWVIIAFDSEGLLSEIEPIPIIKKWETNETDNLIEKIISSNLTFKENLINHQKEILGLRIFINSKNNYQLLNGQKPNLHKLILENCLIMGFNTGLLHDKGIFDDSKGQLIRSVLYKRLKYYFQFQNELKLFQDVGNTKKFDITITSVKNEIGFYSINNLFHPKTIDASLMSSNDDPIGIRNFQNKWELRGNASRIVFIDANVLKFYKALLQDDSPWFQTKLPIIHSSHLLESLKKIDFCKEKLKNNSDETSSTIMLDETKGKRNNIIVREPGYVKENEFVLAAIHYYNGNPIYQTPNENCSSHRDNARIDLLEIEKDHLPRTIYKLVNNKGIEFPYNKNYYYAQRKRAQISNERTLITSIQPPGRIHTDNTYSIHFKDELKMLSFASYSFSIIYDYYVKTTGRENIYFDTVSNLPLITNPNPFIISRALHLTCITQHYSNLWNTYCHIIPIEDMFSKQHVLLDNITFGKRNSLWTFDLSLKSEYARRQALIEIDVLVSLDLGLSLNQLITIYEVVFGVLQTNESSLLFDSNGRIIPSSIKNEISGLQIGEISFDQIKFKAPVFNCNRIEDYKIAWKYFEKVFAGQEINT